MKIRCTYDKIVPISELKLNPKNRNIHPPEQIRRLAEILNYQGWRYPVKVSLLSGLVTSGHGRIEAAKLNNWTGVPVNFQEYENSAQEFADLTADNAIALWAELDEKGIGEDYKEFELELDSNLLGLEEFNPESSLTENQGDPDEVPEVKDAICQEGELWLLGEHRLLCGDSTKREDVERLMNGETADMVFTDPPYGVSYVGGVSHAPEYAEKRNREGMDIENDALDEGDLAILVGDAFQLALECCQPGASWYVTAPARPLHYIFAHVLKNLGVWRQTLNWVKSAFVFGRSDYHYRHEPIFYGWVPGGAHYFCDDRTQDTIWEFPRPKPSDNPGHPTAKPVELVIRAINNSSKPGSIALDPFLGSGSTLIACEKTNRKCFGMEIDPHYCDVIIERWQKYTGKKAVKNG